MHVPILNLSTIDLANISMDRAHEELIGLLIINATILSSHA